MHSMKICSLLLLLNWTAIALADDFPAQLIKNSKSIHFRYSQTGEDEVSHWKISFSGEEIRSIEPFLRNLQPYKPEKLLFISAYTATLKTADKKYRFVFGDEKKGNLPVVFVFRHGGVKKVYRLTGDDAKMFRNMFENAMKNKVKVVEPYLIVKLPKPRG